MDTGKLKILIAEDESIIALDIKSTLEKFGYKVCAVVNNGDEVLTQVEKLMPDLVLMDILLNGKKTGLEIAGHIYERFDIPVVYLSALNDENTIKSASQKGSYGFIHKPFDENGLQAAIIIALQNHSAEKKKTQAMLGTERKSHE